MRRLLPFDFAAISVSVTASFFIRLGWSQRFIDFLPGAILMLAASLLIKPMLMKFFSLYSFHHAASSKYSLSLLNWAQTFSILKATIASSAIIFFLFSPMRYFANFPGLPPTVVIIDCLLFFVMTFVTRWVLVKFGDKTQEFPSIPSNLSTKQFLLGFVALCFLGVVISWKVLAYPFYYDDLHLMRKFTFGEIQSSFSGPWDSDGLEAIGYRPLTKLYNHLRYEFFGENTFAHRVFLISAYSAHLTLLSLVVTKFGVPYRSALVGASLSIVARYNAPHYLWISVGVHTLQLLLFSAALACLIKAIDDRDYIFCSFAILFSVGSLYIREDSISGIIIMLILGYLYIFKNKLSRVFYRQMTYYTVMTLVLSLGYFGLRSIFVPNAGRLQFSFIAIINTLQKILFGYTGMTSFNAMSSALLKGWLFFLVLVAGMFICLLYFYRRSDMACLCGRFRRPCWN